MLGCIIAVTGCQGGKFRDSYSSSGEGRQAHQDRKDSYASASGEYQMYSERDSYSTTQHLSLWDRWKAWRRKRKYDRDSYSTSGKRRVIQKRKPKQGIKPY